MSQSLSTASAPSSAPLVATENQAARANEEINLLRKIMEDVEAHSVVVRSNYIREGDDEGRDQDRRGLADKNNLLEYQVAKTRLMSGSFLSEPAAGREYRDSLATHGGSISQLETAIRNYVKSTDLITEARSIANQDQRKGVMRPMTKGFNAKARVDQLKAETTVETAKSPSGSYGDLRDRHDFSVEQKAYLDLLEVNRQASITEMTNTSSILQAVERLLPYTVKERLLERNLTNDLASSGYFSREDVDCNTPSTNLSLWWSHHADAAKDCGEGPSLMTEKTKGISNAHRKIDTAYSEGRLPNPNDPDVVSKAIADEILSDEWMMIE